MKRFLRSKLFLSLAAFVMIAAAVTIPLSSNYIRAHAQGVPSISDNPTSGPPGTVVTVTGSGWSPGGTVDVRLFSFSGPTSAHATVASDGTFSTTVTVPSNTPLGPFTIFADEAGVKATTTFTVTSSTSTTITAICTAQTAIPLPAFKAGDTVKGTITFTTTDPKEISQNEILVLTDTFTGQQFPFAPTLTPIAQPIPLIFTLGAKSSLVACIQHHDSDETGIVTIKGVISPPPPSSHPDLERLVIYIKFDGLSIPIPIAIKSLESLSKKFAVASCTIGVITKEPKECIDLVLKTVGADVGIIGEGAQLLGVAVSAYACLYVPAVSVPTVALKVLACANVGVESLKELIFPGHH
jgi:hypothetical protein